MKCLSLIATATIALAGPALAAANFPPPNIHTANVKTDARGTWFVDWSKTAFAAKEPPFVQATAVVPRKRDMIVECQVQLATADRAEGKCYMTSNEEGKVALPPVAMGDVDVRVLGVALPASK